MAGRLRHCVLQDYTAGDGHARCLIRRQRPRRRHIGACSVCLRGAWCGAVSLSQPLTVQARPLPDQAATASSAGTGACGGRSRGARCAARPCAAGCWWRRATPGRPSTAASPWSRLAPRRTARSASATCTPPRIRCGALVCDSPLHARSCGVWPSLFVKRELLCVHGSLRKRGVPAPLRCMSCNHRAGGPTLRLCLCKLITDVPLLPHVPRGLCVRSVQGRPTSIPVAALQGVQRLFEEAQASHDPNNIMALLQHHPYHIDALMAMFELHRCYRFDKLPITSPLVLIHVSKPLW